MKFYQALTTLSTILSFSLMAQAQNSNVIEKNETTEVLESPYFIDGFICQGFEGPTQKLPFFLEGMDEERQKVYRSEVADGFCAMVLKNFEIEKYKWKSQNEILVAKNKIKSNSHFEKADLSIIPSELKNHVYLKLTVELSNKETKSVSMTNTKIGNQNDIEVQVSKDWYNGTMNRQKIGFDHHLQLRGEKIAISNPDPNSKYTNELKQYNSAINELSWIFNSGIGKIDTSTQLHLYSQKNSHFTSDSGSQEMSDFELEGNLLWVGESNQGIVKSYYGLAYHYFTPSTYSEYFKNHNLESLIAPGIQLGFLFGNENKSYWLMDVKAFMPLTSEKSLRENIKLEFGFTPEWAKSFADQMIITFNTDIYQNYNSAIGRSSVNSFKEGDIGFDMSKKISLLTNTDKIQVGYHNQTFGENNNDRTTQSLSISGISANYKTNYKDWDISLGVKSLN